MKAEQKTHRERSPEIRVESVDSGEVRTEGSPSEVSRGQASRTMRERRRTGTSSASYTGFKAVESFQYPGIWKKAAQSVTTLLLVSEVQPRFLYMQ